MVYRIYVEKKPGFDGEAQGLLHELVDLVGIQNLTGLRLLNRYDVEGIDAVLEQQLASGRITCAAMSRQLLADPEWPNKVASGQIKEIHRCVRCNKKCLGGLQQHQGTHCIYEKV